MYKCKNAVAMIVFNRPKNAIKVFEAVKKAEPPILYIIADGIRNEKDRLKVSESRKIAEMVDWTCEVRKVFAEENLGCKKRVMTGISEIFQKEDKVIILEDDCVPTEEFFRFQDWALDYFENEPEVAIVSGSNLLEDKFTEQYQNAFSEYINCWGWGTWKRTWEKFDPFLSIQELNGSFGEIAKNMSMTRSQKKYWLLIFRHSIYTRTIWDFYLQYFFFKYSWKSVYPAKNLIYNIGFGEDSTHMKHSPEYIQLSKPNNTECLFEMPSCEYSETAISRARDMAVIRRLYGFSFFSLVKLYVGNLLRYLGIRK